MDGYVELPQSDGSAPWTIVFEFMGCHVHKCPVGCQKSMQTHEAVIKDYQRLADIEQAVDELRIMRSCEWQEKRKHVQYTSTLSQFIGKSNIVEHDIFEAIRNDAFFGIVRVDLRTPEDIVAKYKHLNFPLIFGEAEITEDMLAESVAKQAAEANVKLPYKCMTLKWNSDGIILATPLLQFYLSIGLQVSNLQWALQYNRSEPFKDFVQEMVNVRINSYGTNKPLGDRAKFTLNSCVGRFGMNLIKHRNTSYALEANLYRHIRTPLVEKERRLVSEYDIPIHEVTKRRRSDVDKVPVHISLFVYQLSKLLFFRFVLILHEYLQPDSYTLCYLGMFQIFGPF